MISEADKECRPIKVLLVEDDEEDFFIIRSILSRIPGQYYELQWIGDYDTALAALARKECDACLLDYRLGSRSGIEFLKDSLASGCRAPIIFLTGKGDYRIDVEAMEAGATDYLSKADLNADLLERSIRYAMERAAARRVLQEQKFLLETLLANAPVGIALMRGPDFVFEIINPPYQAIVSGNRVVGKSFQEVWPEIADEFLPVLERVRRTGEPYQVADAPFRIRRTSEAALEERFFNVVVARVVDDDALIAMVVETTEKVVERRRAEGLAKEIDSQSARLKQVEETLQESRANLQAALDSMVDAVFITDLEGRFIEFNDALAKFYRFGSKQECAKTLAEYPKFLDACMDDGRPVPFDQWAVPRALRGERGTNAEYTLRRKDTGETWIGSYSFGPIRDGRGAIVGSVVVGRDITEQRRAEIELYNSHQEKTALLKEVHHRVKNNLQFVISLLGLQANRSRNPEVIAVFKDTRNRIRSMALLHELLYRSGNFAQISFAAYIEDFLRNIVASYGRAAQRIKLEHRVGDLRLSLHLAVPCGLIVNELVTNALKHAFPGDRPGKIVVEFDRTDGAEVFLSVCDNGIGLPPEAQSHTPSTLGLTLVSELCRQLSGRLTVESPAGGGTVFRIRFPVSADTSQGAQK